MNLHILRWMVFILYIKTKNNNNQAFSLPKLVFSFFSLPYFVGYPHLPVVSWLSCPAFTSLLQTESIISEKGLWNNVSHHELQQILNNPSIHFPTFMMITCRILLCIEIPASNRWPSMTHIYIGKGGVHIPPQTPSWVAFTTKTSPDRPQIQLLLSTSLHPVASSWTEDKQEVVRC